MNDGLLSSLNVSVEQVLAAVWAQHVHLTLSVHEHEFAWREGLLALGWRHIKGDTSALHQSAQLSALLRISENMSVTHVPLVCSLEHV